MRVFISGGCKNGKSYYAQRLAKQQAKGKELYYIATMAPVDPEDDERILRHQKEREGWGFATIEQQKDIRNILNTCDCGASFLLDSLTALLGNEMFLEDGSVNTQAHEKIWSELLEILNKVENIVIVSDYMYSDADIYDPLTEMYRKHLAGLDRLAAKQSDVVLEAAYNQIIAHKGGDVFYEACERMPGGVLHVPRYV